MSPGEKQTRAYSKVVVQLRDWKDVEFTRDGSYVLFWRDNTVTVAGTTHQSSFMLSELLAIHGDYLTGTGSDLIMPLKDGAGAVVTPRDSSHLRVA